jgi:hypothetical protein
MGAEVEHREIGNNYVLALSLQVHLEREAADVCEHDRDVPDRDYPSNGRDLGVLADEH